MRKSWVVGIAVIAILIAGLSLAWVESGNRTLAVSSLSAFAEDTSVNQAITDSGHAAIKNAIAAVGPAVVRIDVTGSVAVTDPFSDFRDDPFFRRFFGDRLGDQSQERETQGLGSGVVFEHAGDKLILTNAHVVDNADTISVTDISGNSWTAIVVGADDLLDVAVLRLDGDTSALPTATFGDSDVVEIGDWAIAIGNPLGLSYSVTLGIISATDRDIAKPDNAGRFNNLIQTDAAINPGNSGGPLVNVYGEVIGLNTMIARGSATGVVIEGINFAVSINGVKDVLDRLILDGAVARGWLGIQTTDITPNVAESHGLDPELVGALVVGAFAGDPADAAGIEAGDVVIRIGDATIESADDLVREIARTAPGTVVEIEVLRNDEPVVVQVTLGERPSEDALATYQGKTPADEGTAAGSELGITVGPITRIIAGHLGLNSTEGVVIIGVAAGSRAASAGLAEGDVVLEVDHRAIATTEEWNQAIAQVEEGASVTLTILRNGKLGFLTIE